MEKKSDEMRIRVGQIINVHGLRGEVKVYPLTDYPERFDEIRYLFLDQEERKRKIQSVKYHKNMAILKLEGIDSVENAERIREKYLFIDRENVRELDEDEHLIIDLIGLEVVDLQGKHIGVLKEVLPYSANDVYVVCSDEGEEYMIPGLKRFVPKIDMQEGKIFIDPIEGMIEL